MSGQLRKSLGPIRRRLTDAIASKPEIRSEFESPDDRGRYLDELTVYIELLKSKFHRFKETYDKLVAFDSSTLTEDELKIVYGIIEEDSELISNCDDIIVEINLTISKIQRPDRTTNNNLVERAPTINFSKTVRLPELQLPKFDGDIKKWFTFWDVFKSSVHENNSLSPIDKMNYLKAQLTGEASLSISGLSATADNYISPVDILRNRFGNTRVIIDSHFLALTNLAAPSNTTVQLRKFLDSLIQNICSLEALGERDELRNFVPILQAKLPAAVRLQLEQMNNGGGWTMEAFRRQLSQLITMRETVEVGMPSTTNPVQKNEFPQRPNFQNRNNFQNQNNFQNRQHFPNRATASALVTPNKNPPLNTPNCAFCVGGHWSDHCPNYTTTEARKTKIHGNCFVCLRSGHKRSECKRSKACFYCKKIKQHHSSLCPEKYSPKSTANATNVIAEQGDINKGGTTTASAVTDTSLIAMGETVYLPTAKTEIYSVDENDNKTIARVLFDSGSQRSYISAALAKKLNLKTKSKQTLTVFTFGNTAPKEISTTIVDLKIKLIDGTFKTFSADVVPTITGGIYRAPFNFENTNFLFKTLILADPIPTTAENFQIDFLIGNDYYWDIITSEKIEISNGLYLINSKLGWILNGRQPIKNNNNHRSSSVLLTSTVFPSINQSTAFISADPSLSSALDVQKFWDLETIGIKDRIDDVGDEESLRVFNDNVKIENSRYYVKWPYKDENPDLPSNYHLALGRLNSMLRRYKNQPEILEKYQAVIDDQLQQGIIEKIDDSNSDNLVHYIPHHPVITPHKEHTKLRIVYDGSAKTKKENLSINECLHRGPVMLEDLIGILMRFRLNKIALVADIEKAFLQVGLQEPDRDVVRFLWLRDPKKLTTENNLQIYRFTRIPFGIISSPFLLSASVAYHLQKADNKISSNILRNIYVDNIITGVQSTENAIEFYKETKNLFGSMSMNIRDWASNSSDFTDQLPDDDRASNKSMKILGIPWNSTTDLLSIDAPTEFLFNVITKRTVLQFIASIFDPLGIFSPTVLIPKLFLQTLWTEKIDWDDHLSEEKENEWKSILSQIIPISKVTFNRFINVSFSQNSKYELHCFCDASQRAYGACVYLRIITPTEIISHLLFSKSRLAPIDKLTLPRLELLAVQIGSQIINTISKSLDITIDRLFIWSDSQCVLHWLNSKKPLSVFVRNRIKKIKEVLNVDYRYIRTHENPADFTSRGKSVDELSQSKLWWHGPTWLINTEENWPSAFFTQANDEPVMSAIKSEETLSNTTIFVVPEGAKADITVEPPFGIKIKNYSSISKTFRITAYIMRFIDKLKKVRIESEYLNGDELKRAKSIWIKYIQQINFSELISSIEKKKRHPIVDQLGVWIDSEGILRCGGRLSNSSLSAGAIHPILLPKKHYFTSLIIKKIHENLFHVGVSHTLARIRDEFWIPAGRSVVFKFIQSCIKCKKFDGGPYKAPEMPNLPKSRVTASPPFTSTGLDYFGPLFIKVFENDTTTTKKVWVCIFTCLSTRAVHLEVINDMTATEFLLCLRRFISRRGKPNLIISDNAKNFKFINLIIKKYCGEQSICWKFITERAPWMGGFYERLIRLIKQALRKSIGSASLTLIQLQTIITEIESVTNSRPLTYVGGDFETGRLITPGHFLSINAKMTFQLGKNYDIENEISSSKQKIIVDWQHGQKLVDSYWKIWRDDYLKNLRERTQRNLKQPRVLSRAFPKIDEIVQMKNPGPRGTWQIARIIDLVEGTDGKIRSARILLPTGTKVLRAIAHLYPLECGDDEISGAQENDGSDEEVEF